MATSRRSCPASNASSSEAPAGAVPAPAPLTRRRRTGDDHAGDPPLDGGQRDRHGARTRPTACPPLAERAQRPERRQHRVRVGQAQLGILGQHVGHAVVDRGRNVRREVADPRRLDEQDLGQQRRGGLGLEHRAAGQALEHHAAEREDVGARRDVARAAHQLGRHVAGRPDHRAGAGQLSRRAGQPGDAEVEHLQPLDGAAGQEQIPGFDVAMDDPRAVRVGQRFGHAAGHGDRLGDGRVLAFEAFRQVLAVEPLHGDVARPALGDAVGDVADDGRMDETGQDGGLLLEPLRLANLAAGEDLTATVAPVVRSRAR